MRSSKRQALGPVSPSPGHLCCTPPSRPRHACGRSAQRPLATSCPRLLQQDLAPGRACITPHTGPRVLQEVRAGRGVSLTRMLIVRRPGSDAHRAYWPAWEQRTGSSGLFLGDRPARSRACIPYRQQSGLMSPGRPLRSESLPNRDASCCFCVTDSTQRWPGSPTITHCPPC